MVLHFWWNKYLLSLLLRLVYLPQIRSSNESVQQPSHQLCFRSCRKPSSNFQLVLPTLITSQIVFLPPSFPAPDDHSTCSKNSWTGKWKHGEILLGSSKDVFFYLKNSIESMFYFIGQGKANFCFSSERAGQVLSKAALLIRFLAKLKFSGFKGWGLWILPLDTEAWSPYFGPG